LSSKSSHGSWVVSDVDTLLFQEIGTAIFDDLVVKVFTSQMSITGSGLDLEDTIVNA
jgi:hypothetical protein